MISEMHHRPVHRKLAQALLGTAQWLLQAPAVLQDGKDLLQAPILRQYARARRAHANMSMYGPLQGRVCLIEGYGDQAIFLEAARKCGASLLHTVSLT